MFRVHYTPLRAGASRGRSRRGLPAEEDRTAARGYHAYTRGGRWEDVYERYAADRGNPLRGVIRCLAREGTERDGEPLPWYEIPSWASPAARAGGSGGTRSPRCRCLMAAVKAAALGDAGGGDNVSGGGGGGGGYGGGH